MLHAPWHARVERLLAALDLPLAILAIALIPALFLEGSDIPGVADAASALNWIVWLAFVIEFVGHVSIAPAVSQAIRGHWFDLAVIVISPPFLVPDLFAGARTLRAYRLLRLVRILGIASIGIGSGKRVLAQRRLLFVGLTGLVTVCVGAFGVFVAEAGSNSAIRSLGDAFWWAIVTATTVGYGDLSPVTREGRAIAICLMLVGIGIIGVFTATVASAFLDSEQATQAGAVETRLAAIETKLDLLLKERDEDRAQEVVRR